jgi:hypothetical protein
VSEPLTTEIRVEGAEESKKSIMEFFEAYRSGKEDVRELNKAMREQYSSLYGMRRALSLVRTEWRMQHAVWVSGARVMRDVGRIGRTLTSMWQAYTLGMMRVEQAQRDVRSATMDVSEAQQDYNRYLEIFGEDSVYAKDALSKLNVAIEAEKAAIEAARKAQEDFNLGLLGLGLSFGSVGADIITAIGHIDEFIAVLGTAKASLTAFLAVPVLGVAAPVAGLGALGVLIATGIKEIAKADEKRKAALEGLTYEEYKLQQRQHRRIFDVTALIQSYMSYGHSIEKATELTIDFGLATETEAQLAADAVKMMKDEGLSLVEAMVELKDQISSTFATAATQAEELGDVLTETTETATIEAHAYTPYLTAEQRALLRQHGGYIPEEGWYYLHAREEVLAAEEAEEYRRTRRTGIEELMALPETYVGTEFAAPYERARTERIERRQTIVRQVRINIHIDKVARDIDVDRMAKEAYRKLMRKMEAIR